MAGITDTDHKLPQEQTINLKELKKKKLDKKTLSIVIGIGIVTIGAIIGGVILNNSRTSASNVSNSVREVLDSQNSFLTPSPLPTPSPIVYQNPFNGLPISKETQESLTQRPLAIMMDNSPQARAVQQNLNRSDMVYEALVEGGYTRFMGIYYSDQNNFKVMPIRSVRMVFLDNLTELNDILLYHVGGALTPEEPRTNALQRIINDKVKSVYYFAGNLGQIWGELYDEQCAKNPNIPGYSCKYRFTGDIWKKATDVGYQKDAWEPDHTYDWSWKFNANNANKSDIPATAIKYNFAGNNGFDADWTYDPITDKYLRKINKKALMDNASQEQVWTNTIIVQKIKYQLNVDDKLRVISNSDGSGDAYIFSKGKAFEVLWKKTCNPAKPKVCRTRYFSKDTGDEFVFAPGKVWVSITRIEEKVNFE
jgi:hypothetical protein